jgi:putative ABC transport system ATP-binding protein
VKTRVQRTLDSSMSLIKLEELTKLYGFGDAMTLALNEITLTIDEGEFVGIMGPSGCGKSTLMNIIGMLDRPTHGTYLFNNRKVSRLRTGRQAKIRRDEIGFIFQSFNLLPRLTVLENVALPLEYKGSTRGTQIRHAREILKRVGLHNKEFFYPNQLSGGQAQCVAIARALVNNPKVIIADEPTGNLDSASSRLVMELLSEVHKTGNTVLMVTHNPELTRYTTRVVYMHDGEIVHDEQTKLGEVAPVARRLMYSPVKMLEEDDLAGVSALMNAVPGADTTTSDKKAEPKKRKRKTAKPRKKPDAKRKKATK